MAPPANPIPYLVAQYVEAALVCPCTIDTSSDRMGSKRTGRGEGHRWVASWIPRTSNIASTSSIETEDRVWRLRSLLMGYVRDMFKLLISLSFFVGKMMLSSFWRRVLKWENRGYSGYFVVAGDWEAMSHVQLSYHRCRYPVTPRKTCDL